MNPHVLANWDNLCLKRLPLTAKYNCFALTSQLECLGSGLLGQSIAAKQCRTAYFHANRPSLPLFVSDRRKECSYASNNCLVGHRTHDQNLLLFSHENKIIGLSLFDNQSVGDSESPLTKSHRYRRESAVSYGPFRQCTDNYFELFQHDPCHHNYKPVLGLATHTASGDNGQIQAIARNRIQFFEFAGEASDLRLDLVTELNIESLRRSDGSRFDFCDRNQLIDNQLLLSYNNDDVIDLYDIENMEMIRSFESNSFEQKSRNQIGLNWCQDYPQKFLYGEHKKLVYCDVRSLKPAMNLVEFNKCDNLHEWELFYRFLPSKLNPNQVFVATDFHIVIVDYRYPTRSLLQQKHMLPDHIIRAMESTLVNYDYTDHEVLITTNFYRNCLMSFCSKPGVVQLTSTHLPLHLADLRDIDFYRFRNCYYRGAQLLPSKDGFSAVLLSNVGDVFVQDYYWNDPEKGDTPEDITWSRGVGSSDLQVDRQTVEYMSIVQNFLERINPKDNEDEEEEEAEDDEWKRNRRLVCRECFNSVQCREVNGECGCTEPKHLTGLFRQESTSQGQQEDVKEDINLEKYFSEELIEMFDKIENNEFCNDLWEESEDYSKDLYSLWADDQPMDQTSAAET